MQVLKDKVKEVIVPELEAMGLDLVDIVFSGNRGKTLIRLYIDRIGEELDHCSLTIADCEKVSRSIERLLDVEDVLSEDYTLEVSTPGIERPLGKIQDYRRFKGQLSKVTLNVEGKDSFFIGRIKSTEGDLVVFDVDGRERRVNICDIKKASLKFER